MVVRTGGVLAVSVEQGDDRELARHAATATHPDALLPAHVHVARVAADVLANPTSPPSMFLLAISEG